MLRRAVDISAVSPRDSMLPDALTASVGLGVLMQLTGVWLWAMAARELHTHGMPPVTLSAREPPSKLCQSGVFAFSRNPMCASSPWRENMLSDQLDHDEIARTSVHTDDKIAVASHSRLAVGRARVCRRWPGGACCRHCRPSQHELRPFVREPTAAVEWCCSCTRGGTAAEGREPLHPLPYCCTCCDRLWLAMCSGIWQGIY